MNTEFCKSIGVLAVGYLIGACVLAVLYHVNSLVLMGITDPRAAQCATMAAVVLGCLFLVAGLQARHSRRPVWFLRVCVLSVLYTLVGLAWGAMVRPYPTPQLLLGGWATLLIVALTDWVIRRLSRTLQ